MKFFLNVSLEEQRNRFLRRIDQPSKNWKFSLGDLKERKLWPKYTQAYEAVLSRTSTEYAPWYIIDSTDKRRARLNCISHLLSRIPYEDTPQEEIELPGKCTQTLKPGDILRIETPGGGGYGQPEI